MEDAIVLNELERMALNELVSNNWQDFKEVACKYMNKPEMMELAAKLETGKP